MEPKKYKQILDIGLSLDAFQALVYIVEKTDFKILKEYTKFESLLVLLERKDLVVYMNSVGTYEVTQAGKDLYQKVGAGPTKVSAKAVKPKVITMTETEEILNKIKAKLSQLTGKTQVQAFGNIPFIPSLSDFQTHLKRFQIRYPTLYNLEKIEKCLINHTVNCHQKSNFSPCIKYFIHKEGTGSPLSAYLESYNDAGQETSQYGIVDSKDLFE
jgi:hypothetical protein